MPFWLSKSVALQTCCDWPQPVAAFWVPAPFIPDLVQRLANEATKAARHVLTMCIRALDYCPPFDITFGEYLRAIISADCDLVEDDRLRYRVAFVEAFRRRSIYPPGMPIMSLDRLIWRTPENYRRDSLQLEALFDQLRLETLLALQGSRFGLQSERQRLFELQRQLRRKVHNWLEWHFQRGGIADAEYMGLDPSKKFEVHVGHIAFRRRPDGGVVPQLLAVVRQAVEVPIDPSDPNGPTMLLEGGSSIVGDMRQRVVKYCIRKSLKSPLRLAKQQSFVASSRTSASATYTRTDPNGSEKEPFALFHRGL